MDADRAIFLLQKLMWTAALLAGPVLVATLVVGVLVSILQVATQIQESTLAYVPKLIAAALMLMLLGGWMLGTLTQFATTLYQNLPAFAS
ncbi:MAG: flagellar biosynthesis protein FliQ [Hyphomonadaceae bacterium]|nr:MAG: flagellar biosynthetic protein FliQ [Caulobacteraceae bacterium]MBT9445305.1 flagellar biosynthesis protein FliQ [Hyphomonadaceae bacterium]TPW05683.1 MAG: flagellar biosynthetic protein FliQ [Alphaproteobacteria bacterium]